MPNCPFSSARFRPETITRRFGKTSRHHQGDEPALNDPRKFKAPYNPKERIWQEADRVRAAHPAGRELPVKVLDLAEFDLHLDLVGPVNGLREQLFRPCSAAEMCDWKSIYPGQTRLHESALRTPGYHLLGFQPTKSAIWCCTAKKTTDCNERSFRKAHPPLHSPFPKSNTAGWKAGLRLSRSACSRRTSQCANFSSCHPIRASRRLFRLAGRRRSRPRLHCHTCCPEIRRFQQDETTAGRKALAAAVNFVQSAMFATQTSTRTINTLP